jgi:hypothetical protein
VLAQRFLTLAAVETDVGRLANFHSDIKIGVGKIRRECRTETRVRLEDVLKDRFLIDFADEKARRQERRRARQASALPQAGAGAGTVPARPRHQGGGRADRPETTA